METYRIKELINQDLGYLGRMISGSKTGYCRRRPVNLVAFNANICTKNEKIWWGDIDITLDIDKLKKVSMKTGIDLYILYEMDGRFENEEKPPVNKYIIKIFSDGNFELGESTSEYYDVEDGTIKLKNLATSGNFSDQETQ